MWPRLAGLADVEAMERQPLAAVQPAADAIAAFEASAGRHADRVAIKVLTPGDVDGPVREIRYGELAHGMRQTANLLHRLGLRRGEVVSFLLPLVPQAYELILGGEAVGIVNTVNPLLEPWQLARILKAARTKILVTAGPAVAGGAIWQKVQAIRGELPELETILQVGGPDSPEAPSFDALKAREPGDRFAFERTVRPADVASYFHTGGTTGTPKLAQHTHAMQASQMWSTAAGLGFVPGDVLLAGLPLFHIGGSIVCALVPLAHGVTLLLLSPAGFRDPAVIRDMWKIVERHRVTLLGAVPTVLGALLNVPVGDADISSIRAAVTGGSAMPVEVGRALGTLIGKPVWEGYGMTETTSYVTLPPRDAQPRLGSVGTRLPHVEVKVAELGADGRVVRDCAPDEVGVVLMRGACVMPGYVQEAYNREAFAGDGWLNSGDLGRMDADGWLWLVGRAKDLIIRGGHNIDPAVIEEALHQHPAVELAAAVGRPDAYAGELPVVYVQLRPGGKATADELSAFARQHIAERAAAPVAVLLVEAMPLTGVGKIFKPALRWDAAAKALADVLAPLEAALGAAPEVSVGADEVHGTLARVRVRPRPGASPPDADAVRQAVAAALAPFALRHTVEVG